MSGVGSATSQQGIQLKLEKTLGIPVNPPQQGSTKTEAPSTPTQTSHQTPPSDTNSAKPVSAHGTEPKSVSFGAPSKPAKSPEASQTTGAKPVAHSSLNSQAAFHDTNTATAAQIDKILTKYNSPHAGKGKEFLEICKKNNMNPVLMLSIMQQESGFGSKKLKVENQANPFSVHFNEHAKGINKLRLPDGSLPSLERSLDSAARTMNKWSAGSSTPLTTAGKHYCTTASWSNNVTSHYNNLMKKLGN